MKPALAAEVGGEINGWAGSGPLLSTGWQFKSGIKIKGAVAIAIDFRGIIDYK